MTVENKHPVGYRYEEHLDSPLLGGFISASVQ